MKTIREDLLDTDMDINVVNTNINNSNVIDYHLYQRLLDLYSLYHHLCVTSDQGRSNSMSLKPLMRSQGPNCE